MPGDHFNQPDGEAITRLLDEHWRDPTGIVVCLAWREGLTRAEISDLTWEQVDFDARVLRLPDREVPLEDKAAQRLRQWKQYCEPLSGYVAVSRRTRGRLAPPSITTLARTALDKHGQTGVRLEDLRFDFIRRQFREHDWPYVLRITGISLSTYRAGLYRLAGDAPAAGAEEPEDDVGEEFRLWRVMQNERDTPAGIALWLTSQLGLQCEEIARLTWEDVDFKAELLRLPDREVPLTVGVRNVLTAERARRGPGDDPHVLLTPRSRKPMDAARLTTLTRAALIRGGIENRTMQDFRRDVAGEDERRLLSDYLAKNDFITRAQAAELWGVSMGQAYARLTKRIDSGELARLGSRYYLAEEVVPPEQREEAVLRLVRQSGPVYRRDVSRLLRVGRHRATEILNRLVAEGKLQMKPGAWQYMLPEKIGEEAVDAAQ